MYHFFVKAIVFFELLKALSFAVLFTFRISAKKLFMFLSSFSLQSLLFLKWGSYL